MMSDDNNIDVKFVFWAEMGGKRIENDITLTVPLPVGCCKELAKESAMRIARSMLEGLKLKRGVDFA